MSFEGIEQDVIRLGHKWDLYEKSTEETRLAKIREEALELVEAIDSGIEQDILMESGDVIVTLINWLYPKRTWIGLPLGMAHAKNLNRTGVMQNGAFVREK